MSRLLKVLFLITVLTIGVFSPKATAHDWYPPACCAGQDCHPIDSCFDLNENDDGSYDYGHLHFRKDQVHPSQDSKCHVCVMEGNPFNNYTQTPMCVFVHQGT